VRIGVFLLVSTAAGCHWLYPFPQGSDAGRRDAGDARADLRPDLAPDGPVDLTPADLMPADLAWPDLAPDLPTPDLGTDIWPLCPDCACGKSCSGTTCVCKHPTPACSYPPTPAEELACEQAEGAGHCCQLGCCSSECGGCPYSP